MAKKQTKYSQQYAKERAKLLRNISSLENRGYDVSSIEIPDIPANAPSARDVERLKNLNKKRYDKATKTVAIERKRGQTTEHEIIQLSGKAARTLEHKKRAQAKQNAEKYKDREDLNIYEDAEGNLYLWDAEKGNFIANEKTEDIETVEIVDVKDLKDVSPLDYVRYEAESGTDIDPSNPESGSFGKEDYKNLNQTKNKRRVNDRQAENQKIRETKFANVIADLTNYANASGLPKRYRNKERTQIVMSNAQRILDQFIEWAATDPDAFYYALDQIERMDGFSQKEFLYRAEDTEKYIGWYTKAMADYKSISEYEATTETYNEQKYEE